MSKAKAIMLIGIAILVSNLLWVGWLAWSWQRGVEQRLGGVEQRLMQLEQAVVSMHPELGRAPAPQE